MDLEGRILALDVGSRRVGVAISDPLGLTAQPRPTLDRVPDEAFFEAISRIIEEESVKQAVIGLPIGLKGQKGSSYEDARGLLARFEERWPEIEWSVWDERLTTVEAIRTLRDAPAKKKKQKGIRDQIAAQLILEGFLSFRKRSP